jgi:crotonobetainyl-CoA:carnitine CoA-transferase CaiB-like acyl-CoA transferase
MGPMEGFRVVEINIAAPGRFTGFMFSCLGAEVICIEMPHSTRRTWTPWLDSDIHARWLWYQWNKKSVTLNLKTEEGLDFFYRLAKSADVIIEGYQPGVAEKMRIDYETVKKINPRIVYCSATGYGQTGPYRDVLGHEPDYLAKTGLYDLSGAPGGPPVQPPYPIADISGGVNSAIATLAALHYVARTGKGQYIDVSNYDSMLSWGAYKINEYWLSGQFVDRHHQFGRTPWETKDGKYVAALPTMEPWNWAKFCHASGRDDMIPMLKGGGSDTIVGISEELQTALKETFLSKTLDEWVELEKKENISISPLVTLPEAVADPHALAREMVVERDYSPLGKIKAIGIPFKFSESPVEVEKLPRYGEHTEEVLRELGYNGDFEELRRKKVIE